MKEEILREIQQDPEFRDRLRSALLGGSSRRSVLAGMAGLGGLAALTGSASAGSADHSATVAYPESNHWLSPRSTTQISLDAAVIDDWNGFDASTGSIVSESGRYLILGQIRYNSPNDTTQIQGRIRVNGSPVNISENHASISSNITSPVWSVESLNSGDTIQLFGRQDSDDDVEVFGGETNTWIAAIRM